MQVDAAMTSRLMFQQSLNFGLGIRQKALGNYVVLRLSILDASQAFRGDLI